MNEFNEIDVKEAIMQTDNLSVDGIYGEMLDDIVIKKVKKSKVLDTVIKVVGAMGSITSALLIANLFLL